MGVPELDLLIAFYGGNYSDLPISFIPQREYVPRFILTAVEWCLGRLWAMGYGLCRAESAEPLRAVSGLVFPR
jgi:hypothetical protein